MHPSGAQSDFSWAAWTCIDRTLLLNSAIALAASSSASAWSSGNRQRRIFESTQLSTVALPMVLSVTLAKVNTASKIPAGPTWALLDDLIDGMEARKLSVWKSRYLVTDRGRSLEQKMDGLHSRSYRNA